MGSLVRYMSDRMSLAPRRTTNGYAPGTMYGDRAQESGVCSAGRGKRVLESTEHARTAEPTGATATTEAAKATAAQVACFKAF